MQELKKTNIFSTYVKIPFMTLNKLNSEGLSLVGHYIMSS